MMESTSFYMILPSSTNKTGNTASAYQVPLPKTIYLRNKYEVALAEITYPHTWSTFNKHEDFMFTCTNAEGELQQVYIQQGYYKRMNDLMTKMNDALEEFCGDNAWFVYLSVSGRVRLHIKASHDTTIMLGQGLADVLGFEAFKNYTETTVSPYIADINRGFYNLYVYCNICEPQIVGDTYVPLLRTVYITGNQGQIINNIYDAPHYVPVNTDTLETIEINIKNDMNELVSFKTGKVICKLHFRQKAL